MKIVYTGEKDTRQFKSIIGGNGEHGCCRRIRMWYGWMPT